MYWFHLTLRKIMEGDLIMSEEKLDQETWGAERSQKVLEGILNSYCKDIDSVLQSDDITDVERISLELKKNFAEETLALIGEGHLVEWDGASSTLFQAFHYEDERYIDARKALIEIQVLEYLKNDEYTEALRLALREKHEELVYYVLHHTVAYYLSLGKYDIVLEFANKVYYILGKVSPQMVRNEVGLIYEAVVRALLSGIHVKKALNVVGQIKSKKLDYDDFDFDRVLEEVYEDFLTNFDIHSMFRLEDHLVRNNIVFDGLNREHLSNEQVFAHGVREMIFNGEYSDALEAVGDLSLDEEQKQVYRNNVLHGIHYLCIKDVDFPAAKDAAKKIEGTNVELGRRLYGVAAFHEYKFHRKNEDWGNALRAAQEWYDYDPCNKSEKATMNMRERVDS